MPIDPHRNLHICRHGGWGLSPSENVPYSQGCGWTRGPALRKINAYGGGLSPSSDRAGVLTEHVNSPAGHETQPYGKSMRTEGACLPPQTPIYANAAAGHEAQPYGDLNSYSDRAGVLTEHVNSPAGHEAQPYGKSMRTEGACLPPLIVPVSSPST